MSGTTKVNVMDPRWKQGMMKREFMFYVAYFKEKMLSF